MKKLLTILMVLCLLVCGVTALTVSAADEPANEPEPGTVLRVGGLKKNGTTVVIGDYKSFEDGWNYAMDLASDSKSLKESAYERAASSPTIGSTVTASKTIPSISPRAQRQPST